MSSINILNNDIFDYLISNEISQTFFLIVLFILIIILFYDNLFNNPFFINKSKKKILDSMSNTPIIYIKSLSQLTGHNIYAKCEYLSHYSSKDRVIKKILLNAKKKGKINKNIMIYENSTGFSGYSTACISQLLGLKSTIVVPDSCPKNLISQYKKTNCKLILTKNEDFSNFTHNYIRLCKKLSNQDKNSFYINLYQNELNYITHFEETGPELYKQLNHKVDAFVCGSDTGGTISGISNYLKIKNNKCFVALADNEGSRLYYFIKEGVLFRKETAEEKKAIKELGDNKAGNCFLNNNIRKANIDDCYLCSFYESMFIIDYLKKNDGIDIGFKEGVNLVGILKMIKDKNNILPKKANIVTIFSDNGSYDSEKIKTYNHDKNPIKDIEQIYTIK